MEDKEAKIDVSEPEWSFVDNTFTQTLANNRAEMKKKKKKKTTIIEILKQQKLLPIWNKIFLLVSVIAVSLDPLFLYIPMIDQEKNCIDTDKKLRKTAVVLRSILDVIYAVDIIYYIAKAYEVQKREDPSWVLWKRGQFVDNALALTLVLSWTFIVTDILSILPIPQVTILVLLPKWSVSGSVGKKWLNLLLLSQYAPRIFRIYLSCRQLKWTQDQLTGLVWVKGGFNFFLYILSSHVFGGIWYFYAFQRETSCWHQACSRDDINGCKSSIHTCEEIINTSRNFTSFLNLKCPVNPTNATAFNFGMFSRAVESGVLGSHDFPEKLFICFWWGLRHLSSFGQNLETSNYFWENFFAISISIIGLLLFLYLIGNLQTYMQLATTRSEEIGKKMTLKHRDIELWIQKNGLPKDLKTSILHKVRKQLQENKDVGVDIQSLLSILPFEDRKSIKRHLCLPILRKVPTFLNMDEKIVELICEHLKPVMYNEGSYIIREGDPLDRMLFIIQGTAWEYTNSSTTTNTSTNNNTNGDYESRNNDYNSSSSRIRRLKKCDWFGEELVQWVLTHNSISEFPISSANLKSHTKVEAFVFMANDLMNAVRKDWWLFRRNQPQPNSTDSQPGLADDQWQAPAVSAIQRTFRRRNKKKKSSNTTPPQLAAEGGRSQSSKYMRLRH